MMNNGNLLCGIAIKEYAHESGGDVIIHNIPAYAPQLNPDEQVWNHAES